MGSYNWSIKQRFTSLRLPQEAAEFMICQSIITTLYLRM